MAVVVYTQHQGTPAVHVYGLDAIHHLLDDDGYAFHENFGGRRWGLLNGRPQRYFAGGEMLGYAVREAWVASPDGVEERVWR